MTNGAYLGMRTGDLDGKSYAKYWNPNMAPLPEHVQQALMHGVEASELGTSLSEANQLLEPRYLPMETGYTRLNDGQIFVATLTKMPGVSGKMIDWWLGWESMETERYKLWHPRAHQSISAKNMNGDDPNLSDREKYLHNPNYVTEYVGGSSLELVLTFSDPSEFLDVSRFEEAKVQTAACAIVGYRNVPMNFGVVIHLIRGTEEGCEMRSRFWLGNLEVRGLPTKGILNKIAKTKFAADHAVPDSLAREMFVHCATEMNHLASFLPDLYADYH